MKIRELLKENKTSLQNLYKGSYPDRDEMFWDYVNSSDLETPLSVQKMPAYKLKIMLLGQYRAEHIDEILDLLDSEQQEILEKYLQKSDLSDSIIVTANDKVIDGNHRALAAAIKNVPINYIDISELDEVVDEMALAKYQPMGDFDKPGPFRGADKRLVPHPKNIEKATKFFEQTPYDFRLFFSNIPGTGRYSEYGPMSHEQIREIFKDQAEEIIKDSSDAITIVFVGNKGDSKVMLTPWIMAHRIGHAIQAGERKSGGRGTWREAENHFFRGINELLKDFYGKSVTNRYDTQVNWSLNKEYAALFNAIGTQRSSRTGQITRPYEFLYELFAQYLGTGEIKLNPLPKQKDYGRKAWGRSTQSLRLQPGQEEESKYTTEVLARDMEFMFDDVLSSLVGKILVM